MTLAPTAAQMALHIQAPHPNLGTPVFCILCCSNLKWKHSTVPPRGKLHLLCLGSSLPAIAMGLGISGAFTTQSQTTDPHDAEELATNGSTDLCLLNGLQE